MSDAGQAVNYRVTNMACSAAGEADNILLFISAGVSMAGSQREGIAIRQIGSRIISQ